MKGKLPQRVIQRRKVGLDIPTHDWLRGPLRALLLDTLTTEALESSKLFRAPVIQKFVRQHLERRGNFGFHLWGLMILFLWMKKWQMQAGPISEAQVESLEGAVTFT